MSKLSALRQELVDVMADVHRRGWCDGTGGNFSCLFSSEPLQLLMAPSGVHKGNVSADELIVVDGNAKVIDGSGKASAETLLHLTIVRSCAAGAVLHSHSQAGTLLSQWALPRGHLKLQDLEMLKGLAGVITHQSSVSVPVLVNAGGHKLTSFQIVVEFDDALLRATGHTEDIEDSSKADSWFSGPSVTLNEPVDEVLLQQRCKPTACCNTVLEAAHSASDVCHAGGRRLPARQGPRPSS